MASLYVVERWGVNQQGCAGIFRDLDKAVEVARKCMLLEKDGWHGYQITRWKVGSEHLVSDNSTPPGELVFETQRNSLYTRGKASPKNVSEVWSNTKEQP